MCNWVGHILKKCLRLKTVMSKAEEMRLEDLNWSRVGAYRTLRGSMFHSPCAVTENARLPLCFNQDHATPRNL